MLTQEEKKAFQIKRETAFRESRPMKPNTTYTRLKYLFNFSVGDEKGWKVTTYCLFKYKDGSVLRAKQIKTLSHSEAPDFSDLSLEEMLASDRKAKRHLAYGKEYDIITGPDGSPMEVYGNGMSVIRKGSKIEAQKM